MNRKTSIKVACLHLILIAVFITLALPSSEQSRAQSMNNRRKFYDIAELIKIIETARDAGMSDEDLKNLKLQDGDQEINVMDYIAELERLKKIEDQKLKEFLSKKFLTVNDVFRELIVREPETIQKLREELVSER
jgi:hypothetical protein